MAARSTQSHTSTSDLHEQDEPRQIDARKFLHNPDNHFVVPGRIWAMLRSGELSLSEADYLIVTDEYVRMLGVGCWASASYLANEVLNLKIRQLYYIRKSLQAKGLLIQVGTKMVMGSPRPVFVTAFSKLGKSPPAIDCRGGLQSIAGYKKNKNKSIKKISGEPPAAASPPTHSRRSPVFIDVETPKHSPVSVELARALHQKLKQMPPDWRQRHAVHATFPTKVWPAEMQKLIDSKWGGGDTAVKLLFERLITSWDKLPPDTLPSHPKVFTKSGEKYLKFVLLPALDKAEGKVGGRMLLDKCPAHLDNAWFEVRNVSWPGPKEDWRKRLTSLATTDASLKAIRKALKNLIHGWTLAEKVLIALESLSAAKMLLQFRPFVKKVVKSDADTFDYLSPKVTLYPAQWDKCSVFADRLKPFLKHPKFQAVANAVKEAK